jgi:tetratricopeptide (TPR) repeat protein
MTPTPEEMREVGGRILALLEPGRASVVRPLLERARASLEAEAWEQVLATCRLAAQESLRADDTGSRATGLAAGALCELAAGDLRRALQSYRRSAQLFHILGESGNEAAASLGYGYVRHQLGDLGQALGAYQHARGLFLRASDEAYAAGALERARHFHRQAYRVEQYANSVLLHPVVEAELPRRPLRIAQVEASGERAEAAVVAYELSVEDRPFSIHGLRGRPRVPLEWRCDRSYFALPVPVERWPALGVRRGDYLLLQREVPETAEDSGWVLRRGADGKSELLAFDFEQGDRTYRPMAEDTYGPAVMLTEPEAGGPALSAEDVDPELIGYVVAVLKPLLKADR